MTREYCAYVIDLLAPWGVVAARAMFGGYGLYHRGQIFAIIVEDTLYFKVTERNRAAYEQAGAAPFSYAGKNGKRVSMSYWQVPIDVLEDAERLLSWADDAHQAAQESKR